MQKLIFETTMTVSDSQTAWQKTSGNHIWPEPDFLLFPFKFPSFLFIFPVLFPDLISSPPLCHTRTPWLPAEEIALFWRFSENLFSLKIAISKRIESKRRSTVALFAHYRTFGDLDVSQATNMSECKTMRYRKLLHRHCVHIALFDKQRGDLPDHPQDWKRRRYWRCCLKTALKMQLESSIRARTVASGRLPGQCTQSTVS